MARLTFSGKEPKCLNKKIIVNLTKGTENKTVMEVYLTFSLESVSESWIFTMSCSLPNKKNKDDNINKREHYDKILLQLVHLLR